MAAWFSSEAFLPSGAFDADVNSAFGMNLPYRTSTSPSAIASPPSSYPQSTNHQNLLPYLNHRHHTQPGRIPPASSFPTKPADSVPLSLSSLRAAQASSQNNASNPLPGHFVPLPPSDHTAPTQSIHPPIPSQGLPPSSTTPISSIPQHIAGASLSRSVSADAAPPTQQTSIYMVQRLVQQNSLIREAWEAERNYLEANRRRAEEVYQEDRALMDDVRQVWESEKTTLLQEIEILKERVHRLEGENATLKTMAMQVTGVFSPMGSQRGSGDGSLESSYCSAFSSRLTSRSQNPSMPNSFSMTDPSSLSLSGPDGACRRAHFRSPGSSRMSPTGPPVMPLDPRTQPEKSTDKDFLSSPADESVPGPIPVIDVQEIDPKLEGIPIKATAVQKHTFSPEDCAAEPLSPKSLPADAVRRTDGSRLSDEGLRSGGSTPLALSPAESKRLTMHAGHTPCHSLSLAATKPGTETSSVLISSDAPTPVPEATTGSARYIGEETVTDRTRRIEAWQEAHPDRPLQSELENEDDRPLSGPLMLKNIPAQDEMFLEAVNQRLQPISQGQEFLPTVMRSSPEESELNSDAEDAESTEKQIPAASSISNDGAQDVPPEQDEDGSDTPRRKNVEEDIPLMFKQTSNFGAPFGAM